MKKFKTYQYKLRPTKPQVNTFEEWLGVCRYVYNTALSIRKYCLDNKVKQPPSFDINTQLIAAKKEDDLQFLKQVHSDVLNDAGERTAKTIDRLFSSWKKGKSAKLRFKNKYTYNSFTFKRGVSVSGTYIKLPKIGKVKFFNSRSLPTNSKIKYCSVIRKLDGWYINIQVELEPQTITVDDSQAVGIDVGVKVFASLSDGTTIESPYFLEPRLQELRILQRMLSRCKKGSKRRDKVKCRIAKLHQKIARTRKDFLHKTSNNLADNYDLIVLEDLKISNMTKLNSTLSRRMLDNGFQSFRTLLAYKAKELIAVPPHYTSQKCSSCGEIDKQSRISQSEYLCTSCGYIDNADLNAAKNILALGRSLRTQRKALA